MPKYEHFAAVVIIIIYLLNDFQFKFLSLYCILKIRQDMTSNNVDAGSSREEDVKPVMMFRDLNPDDDDGIAEIESLCLSCYEQVEITKIQFSNFMHGNYLRCQKSKSI